MLVASDKLAVKGIVRSHRVLLEKGASTASDHKSVLVIFVDRSKEYSGVQCKLKTCSKAPNFQGVKVEKTQLWHHHAGNGRDALNAESRALARLDVILVILQSSAFIH